MTLIEAINQKFLDSLNEALYGLAKETGFEFYAYGLSVVALPSGEFEARFKFMEKARA